jgi:alpha-tubulin suppressor-like RCC1 family protein
VYSWGEHSQGKIGRIVGSRGKSQQITLDLEKIGAKNAINIFCGKNHSFFIDKKNQIFAFGQNNHG